MANWYGTPGQGDFYSGNQPYDAAHVLLTAAQLGSRKAALLVSPEPGPDWAGLLSAFRGSNLRNSVQFVDSVRVQRILSDLQLLLASTRELSELQPLLQGLVNELDGAGSPLSAAQIGQLNTVLANNNFNVTVTAP